MSIRRQNVLNLKTIDNKNDEIRNEMKISIKVGSVNSIHEVYEYKNNEGYAYYVFKYISGMSVLNYNKEHYDMLKEHLVINDDITIFMDCDGLYVVPLKYRYNE